MTVWCAWACAPGPRELTACWWMPRERSRTCFAARPGHDGIPEEDASSPEPAVDEDVSHQRIPVVAPDTVSRQEQEMRNMYITKRMVRDLGPTDDCPACAGKRGVAHTNECRTRMRLVMSESDAGRSNLAK